MSLYADTPENQRAHPELCSIQSHSVCWMYLILLGSQHHMPHTQLTSMTLKPRALK